MVSASALPEPSRASVSKPRTGLLRSAAKIFFEKPINSSLDDPIVELPTLLEAT
jgi:hypothetical protein